MTRDHIFLLRMVLSSLVLAFCAHAQTSYDTRAVPLRTPPPNYPQTLRAAKVEGVVAVELRVDAKGDVTGAIVLKSTDPRLNRYALAAVQKWKFRPATLDDQPVESVIQVPLSFRLED